MRSRFAFALLAAFTASSLAYAQAEIAPLPAAAPDRAAAEGNPFGVEAGTPGPMIDTPLFGGEGCGCHLDTSPRVCGPRGRLWAELDYLYWFTKGSSLPPLISTSPAGTAFGVAGNLSAPGSATIFGREHVNEDGRNGLRLTVGGWIDEEQTLGVEVNGLILEKLTTNFSRSSAQTPILAVPITNAQTTRPDAVAVTFPGMLRGTVSATDTTSGLFGTGVLVRENLKCGCDYRLDVLAGYRYMQFSDRLGLTGNVTNVGVAGLPIGATINSQDRFDATNNFHGFDFGLDSEYRMGPWRLRLLAKMAVGSDWEELGIHGSTVVRNGGVVVRRAAGGVFTGPTNIGDYSRTHVIIIPELGAQAGVQLTRHIRGWVGYSGLYWSEAIWAGKSVNTVVNRGLLPFSTTPAGTTNLQPLPKFGTTSFWAQGVDVGLEVRY